MRNLEIEVRVCDDLTHLMLISSSGIDGGVKWSWLRGDHGQSGRVSWEVNTPLEVTLGVLQSFSSKNQAVGRAHSLHQHCPIQGHSGMQRYVDARFCQHWLSCAHILHDITPLDMARGSTISMTNNMVETLISWSGDLTSNGQLGLQRIF